MKFLVLAFDAQSGVGAGSKGVGQPAKACGRLTLLPWRPKCVMEG
ncbi:hypothetical protein [Caldanaerovirga acetigignens]|nr:hypothetical protein [Caldanaerovirga acetigignens]